MTIFELMKVQYGYEPDGTTKDNIAKLTNSLIAAKISRNNLSDIKSLGFEGSTGCTAAENTKILVSDPLNDFIWQQAYEIGGGNPFYYAAKAGPWDPRQCTTFAWYRFYQYYGYDSGARGSGWINAEQVATAHSDKFVESSSPAPGSIVSFPGTQDNPDGHVAFVEKVEGDTFWYSEGNYENHGIRLNAKSSTVALNNQYCGGNACLVYAVPIK